MHIVNERLLLAHRLSGQRLSIPDIKPLMAHWPCGQHEDYQLVKMAVDKRFSRVASEDARKAINNADPALLAARWWPNASTKDYHVMTDLVIWFGMWDDLIEKLGDDTTAAENLRTATKDFVRCSFGLAEESGPDSTNSFILSFRPIAEEVCAFYSLDQRRILLGHFDQYIDATRLEEEAERSTTIPSLKEYWEVRTLTSGMGTLLGLSELAVQAHLPVDFVKSEAYSTLWVTTIVINSIINDLLSLKKEMKAKSVLNSVAILFNQFGDLDTAVDMSLDHTRQLVELFDRTADDVLTDPAFSFEDRNAMSKVIMLMRTVNTGNLTWSLQAKRYGIAESISEAGDIELIL